MSETMNQPPAQPKKEESFFRRMLNWIRQKLLNNWASKLLALVLAIALWGGLITQDPSLTRTRSFRNVAVTVNGSDTLRRNGFVVISDLNELLSDVDFSVEVPQMQYTNVQASNYNIRVDLSRIKTAGEQEVRLQYTNSGTYGTVTEISPESIRIVVDEYVTEYFIPVNVVTQGSAPEGYYSTDPVCDPARITVSGPKSLVGKVRCAQVLVDLSTLPAREGTVEQAVGFVLLDEAGQEVASDMLQVTSESVLRTRINVSTRVHARRDMPLEINPKSLYTGKPAEGYEVVGVTVMPENIAIAGKKSVVDSISRYTVRKAMSIQGATESVTGLLELNIPMNLAWSSDQQVMVTVDIAPVQGTVRFSAVPVQVMNIPAGMQAALQSPHIAATVSGAQVWLKTLAAEDLLLTCNAAGMSAGTYVVPLHCSIPGAEDQIYTIDLEALTVHMTIAEAE